VSGGETDGAAASRRVLLPHTLDAWRRCSMSGCEWQVPLPAEQCWQHGGPDGPARYTDAWGLDCWYNGPDGEAQEAG
jgi:hypothetical protein